jgi:hypothetical protein
MSVRTHCWDVRADPILNSSKLLDTDGHLDGIATSSRQMLLTDESPEVILAVWMDTWDQTSLTWNLHRIFFELLEAHIWNEDFGINGIPDKMTTLHKSGFIK